MEERIKKTKYKYDLVRPTSSSSTSHFQNSNLVLQGANTAARENEPTGEGASLAGRQLAPFGSLAQREKAPELKTQKDKDQKQGPYLPKLTSPNRKKQSEANKVVNPKKNTQFVRLRKSSDYVQNVARDQNVLNVAIEEKLIYRPKTKETRQIYEQLLWSLQKHMGDVSLDYIKSAADEVLAILKMETLNDNQRKKEVEGILDKMTDEEFNEATVLAQQLIDYSTESAAAGQYKYGSGPQGEDIDVNVEFDDENQSQDGDESDNDDGGEPAERRDDNEDDEDEVIDTRAQQPAKARQVGGGGQGLIEIEAIDAYWLNRLLVENVREGQSPEEILDLEVKLLGILGDNEMSARECERKLFSIIGHDKAEVVRVLVKNRQAIYFCSKFHQAQTASDKKKVIHELQVKGRDSDEIRRIQEGLSGDALLDQATQLTSKYQMTASEMSELLSKKNQVTDALLGQKFQQQNQKLDLDSLQFQQGARLMANKKCVLPKGSTKIVKEGYEEVYVPAVRQKQRDEGEKLIPIKDIPSWAQPAFPEPIKELNQIQSKLYKSAFQSSENLLVCAPTGAGKTNIALLTVLQLLSEKRKSNGKFDTKSFKIVYIAPMKALVAEVVGNFEKRLSSFGLVIRELTGDVNLTKQQIEETHVIVTTPEKWDIVTRKSGDRAYIDLVKLVIIDEIHLLHDLRGPVLEAIVARTIRQIENNSNELVRIVALSATLPNYEDVAAFLRVNTATGLFYFDNSYRPVPLEQIYVGVTEKKALKRMMLMNEICYEKVMERAEKQFQILVFVHSRKETVRTAKIIRDLALAKDELHKFLGSGGENVSKEILQTESKSAKSQDLKDLLPYGIGIHNAGLDRKDRQLVEQLFSDNHIKVLVSTATLAWGVNLPAHTVIIKGTQIYSPEQGKWVELSPQDMLQMIGRAGRPQYDKLGEGIIITNYSELQYYLSLNNQQLPIESQLISQLPDQLNAEIVLGTVSNAKEAINWLAYTYLYIRMLRAPALYGIEPSAEDPLLIQRRADLIHSAALVLAKANMIRYEKRTGTLIPQALGKIAAHYYIKHDSISIYNENMKPHMNMIDMFRLFSLSKEFQFIPIRENEKLELLKFIDKVPIPVKGSLEEGATKINVLLQAYISKFKLDGYDLNADMVYVTQSAGRLMRCLFEICAKNKWAQLAEIALTMCKMVDKRMWAYSMTPLRQFPGIPEEVCRKIEKKEQFTWQHYYDMSSQQIAQILQAPKMGKLLHKLIHQFPRLELEAFIQPLTRTVIRIELSIKADFEWQPLIHGRAEPFQVLVLDTDQEQILHQEMFILKDKTYEEEHTITFTVPLFDPLPPQYFIKVISDRWIQSETVLPVNFKHLVLPDKFAPPMEVQDLHPRLVQELNFPLAEQAFKHIKEFNAIQTQSFPKVYNSDESVFIGAPAGSHNIVCAELAIWRHLQKDSEYGPKIVYISPLESQCKLRYQQWHSFFQTNSIQVKLLLNSHAPFHLSDLQTIAQSDLLITTADKWDTITRKWKIRKVVQEVGLYILDEIHLLSEYPSYEVLASRIRYMQTEITTHQTRIIALSTSLANAKDVTNWLGIPFPANTFNFYPTVRPVPLDIHMQGFDHNNKAIRVLAMEKPAFNMLKSSLKHGAQGIVFVDDRKQARLTGISFMQFAANDENSKGFLSVNEREFAKKNKAHITEKILLDSLQYGIGLIHDGLSDKEIQYIKDLFREGVIKVLIVTENLCWEIGDLECHIVIILDAEKYDGNQHRYVEYSIPDLLQMIGRANKSLSVSHDSAPIASKCMILCHSPKKDYFVKFLQEPLPIESALDHSINDHLNANIVAEVIKTKQDAVDWLTWTFLYRRISQNPNFYNITGRSGIHINDYLSSLIETAVDELSEAKCVEVKGPEELDLEAGNNGKIAAYYNIKWETIKMYSQEIGAENGGSKKMKDLIRILAYSSEFQSIPMRQGEDQLLRQLTQYLTFPIEGEIDSRNKTVILLQCHFNRTPLNVDLRIDQKHVLEKAVKLVHALIDVISTCGHLQPCLHALGLCQMLVQSMWYNQSPLLQVPFMNMDQVKQFKDQAKVEDIADLMNMSDEQLRKDILQVIDDQLTQIAEVCNRYPYVDLVAPASVYAENGQAEIEVTVKRSNVEEEDLDLFQTPVNAPYYPLEKEELWWIIIGDPKTNKLLSIKKVVWKGQIEFKHVFEVDASQVKQQYKVYLFCDSYIGCDQEETVEVRVR